MGFTVKQAHGRRCSDCKSRHFTLTQFLPTRKTLHTCKGIKTLRPREKK